MKILENKDLGISADLKAAWPFWNYGWYGSDGTDWRSYATAGGLKSVPDYAEEATPLTIEQASKWRLLINTRNTGWGEDGAALEEIVMFSQLTVDELISELPGIYTDKDITIAFDGSEITYSIGNTPRATLALPVFKAWTIVTRDAVMATLHLTPVASCAETTS